MLIVCPSCVSSYKVEPAALAGAGAAPRCAHCRQPLRPAAPADVPPLGLTAASLAASEEGSALRGIAGACAILVAVSGALLWHGPIARTVPGAAALYRLAGLPDPAPPLPVVGDLKSVMTPEGLAVEGTLTNPRHTRMPLPRLRLTLRDEADAPLASWMALPPKASLAPGETITFTSHLDKPPAAGHDLAVSFAGTRVAVSDGVVRDAR